MICFLRKHCVFTTVVVDGVLGGEGQWVRLDSVGCLEAQPILNHTHKTADIVLGWNHMDANIKTHTQTHNTADIVLGLHYMNGKQDTHMQKT